MRARLKKWGNSLALRVPSGLLTELDLSENSIVDLTAENG
ncbi:MAG: AbrB/MazE/SpoVT family DNA-binding domain-containing protein [Syntrophobacteraceae bacterium]